MDKPVHRDWVDRLAVAVASTTRPTLLIAHSLGVVTVAHAARLFPTNKVAGAFLVAMPDIEKLPRPAEIEDHFAPIPRDPLPFPSVFVHSVNDPWCSRNGRRISPIAGARPLSMRAKPVISIPTPAMDHGRRG